MTTLIDSLRSGEGGSRVLDALVYGMEHDMHLNGGTFMLEIHGRETFQFKHPTKMHPVGPAALYVAGYDVPPVTTSLDAALALAERVLPGRTVTLYERKGWASVDINMPSKTYFGTAPTAPLALCIAILTALQNKEQGQ